MTFNQQFFHSRDGKPKTTYAQRCKKRPVSRLVAASRLLRLRKSLRTEPYPAFSITVANVAVRFSTISRVTSNSFNFF